MERRCLFFEACHSLGFEYIVNDWKDNNRQGGAFFPQRQLFHTLRTSKRDFSLMERTWAIFLWMGQACIWLHSSSCSSRRIWSSKDTKQADEIEWAEFTMIVNTWCSTRSSACHQSQEQSH